MTLLRHTVATLAYRANKALRGAPPEFSSFHLAAPQTPGQILSHLCDLLDWALTSADGATKWHTSTPGEWDQDVARFYASLEAFDRRLAAPEPIACEPEKLFQGPIADALTHVGQLAMLRRLAGHKIPGENYYVASISVGRCGPDQATPVREF